MGSSATIGVESGTLTDEAVGCKTVSVSVDVAQETNSIADSITDKVVRVDIKLPLSIFLRDIQSKRSGLRAPE
jgi:hypothetical protein